MKKKTILVFTGGGLTPALNPTLHGVIDSAKKNNIKILGGMFGWASLLDEGKIIDLSNLDLSSIKNFGGTILRSSRTNPFNIKNGINQLKLNLKKYKIDIVIAIGGNDTLGAAAKLFQEEKINIIGVPKTIDNDLSNTYWTPGFPSAAHYFSKFIKELKYDGAYSMSRIFVVEAMGQDAGWLTASASYGDADVIIPPEKKVNLNKILNLTLKKYKQNGNYAIIAVSPEAKFDKELKTLNYQQKDSYQVKRKLYICLALQDKIKKIMGDVTVKALYPGNYIQTGKATNTDRNFSIKLGQKAIELVKKEKFGKMVNLIRKNNKIKISTVDLKNVTDLKTLPDDYFDWKNLQVTKKYLDYMEPILGKYKKVDKEPYYKLVKKINK